MLLPSFLLRQVYRAGLLSSLLSQSPCCSSSEVSHRRFTTWRTSHPCLNQPDSPKLTLKLIEPPVSIPSQATLRRCLHAFTAPNDWAHITDVILQRTKAPLFPREPHCLWANKKGGPEQNSLEGVSVEEQIPLWSTTASVSHRLDLIQIPTYSAASLAAPKPF